MRATVMWFRRDLRPADNPALLAAASQGPVVPLFVFDPALWAPAGAPRRAYLLRSPELRHLAGGTAHAPWDAADGHAHGYPERIVEHAEERREAPARLEKPRAR